MAFFYDHIGYVLAGEIPFTRIAPSTSSWRFSVFSFCEITFPVLNSLLVMMSLLSWQCLFVNIWRFSSKPLASDFQRGVIAAASWQGGGHAL